MQWMWMFYTWYLPLLSIIPHTLLSMWYAKHNSLACCAWLQVVYAFGPIQKITMFEKNGGYQALIQYLGNHQTLNSQNASILYCTFSKIYLWLINLNIFTNQTYSWLCCLVLLCWPYQKGLNCFSKYKQNLIFHKNCFLSFRDYVWLMNW